MCVWMYRNGRSSWSAIYSCLTLRALRLVLYPCILMLYISNYELGVFIILLTVFLKCCIPYDFVNKYNTIQNNMSIKHVFQVVLLSHICTISRVCECDWCCHLLPRPAECPFTTTNHMYMWYWTLHRVKLVLLRVVAFLPLMRTLWAVSPNPFSSIWFLTTPKCFAATYFNCIVLYCMLYWLHILYKIISNTIKIFSHCKT